MRGRNPDSSARPEVARTLAREMDADYSEINAKEQFTLKQ